MSPDQAAFKKQTRITERLRHQRMEQAWDEQTQHFAPLYEANLSVMERMRETHKKTQDRIKLERVGLTFAILGTVLSSIVGAAAR